MSSYNNYCVTYTFCGISCIMYIFYYLTFLMHLTFCVGFLFTLCHIIISLLVIKSEKIIMQMPAYSNASNMYNRGMQSNQL